MIDKWNLINNSVVTIQNILLSFQYDFMDFTRENSQYKSIMNDKSTYEVDFESFVFLSHSFSLAAFFV